jgi:hypothetical protein
MGGTTETALAATANGRLTLHDCGITTSGDTEQFVNWAESATPTSLTPNRAGPARFRQCDGNSSRRDDGGRSGYRPGCSDTRPRLRGGGSGAIVAVPQGSDSIPRRECARTWMLCVEVSQPARRFPPAEPYHCCPGRKGVNWFKLSISFTDFSTQPSGSISARMSRREDTEFLILLKSDLALLSRIAGSQNGSDR